ncbi:hypothetical protein THC_1553 [Caldimicrobium thiodismutans]|uniref:Protein kinase domain-containing protein n=1 Tax=Caldimicrobium thiodismutans TaxID=1653476 RepID=A0A0U5AYZ8_9BACT|nr:hypothetical protein [Caldimicrobium thiodismutans]BAU23918.1 hypothetical protein THC_1553 [Caldimicrobium thiodismutans]
MLEILFPEWKNFKFFVYSEAESPETLFLKPFSFKILKRSPSHLVFLLSPFNSEKPLYFLKVYQPRLFKRNRIKAFIKNLQMLKKRNIPVLYPLLIFYERPLFSYLKRHPFYGGILYPFIEEGFLKEELFFRENSQTLLINLVNFIFSLHEKGILLRDTKYNNFFYTKEGFKIFDLDGIKILETSLSKKERLKDLSALAMTLEWIGLKEAGTLIFKAYQNLLGELGKVHYEYYTELKIKKRKKRERKFNLK